MAILKKTILTLTGALFSLSILAQQSTIHILHPYQTTLTTTRSRNYISGHTCRSCKLTVNGKPIKVYPTGAFALQLDLVPGDTVLHFKSTHATGSTSTKKRVYHYKKTEPPHEVTSFRIASVKITPSGKCWLQPGDRIQLRIKAQPGNRILINNQFTAYEQPAAQSGIRGIYQYSHVITKDDPLLQKPVRITMRNQKRETITSSLSPQIKVLDPDLPVIGQTTGKIPYLQFGRGSDRLGGAKINYLDTAILLHITGLFGNQYRVALATGHTAYIPISRVQLLSKGTFVPQSLTGSWKVWGDKKYDYLSIGLTQKLPYTTFQKTDPSQIIIDLYGATANTNWISQLKSAKEIKNVRYEQRSDGILRITIALKHRQQWGYALYYEDHRLIIRVKRQPLHLDPAHLTIAIDAGHGGRNSGAQGPTGLLEKTVTLQVARKLQKLLTAAGASVIMTRRSDETKSMIDRILFLRKADPDLLVSIHCNSAADPVHISGVSTYYRYTAFRPLSQAILDRMLQLGLNNFGNIGRFNFALNGPTEYPNALVEMLFISNPEDEMKALDPTFQNKMAHAIKAGIQDFLNQAR